MELQFEYNNGYYENKITSDGEDKTIQIQQSKAADVRVYSRIENMNYVLIYTDNSKYTNKIFQLSVLENIDILIQSDSEVVSANMI